MVLGWRDDNFVIHELRWDNDAALPMWVTACGLGPITGPLVRVSPETANCLSCIGGEPSTIKCPPCQDTGYLSNGWADLPCGCEAGDTARFVIEEETQLGTRTTSVTGEYLKGVMASWKRK